MPFLFFELVKANNKDAKKFITGNIDYEKIKAYFSQYNHIIEIDNSYYLCGNKIDLIKLEIIDNIITDID